MPARKEGWIVLVGWILVGILAGIFIAPRSLLVFNIILGVLSVGLVLICYAKGEPPRWRWGR